MVLAALNVAARYLLKQSSRRDRTRFRPFVRCEEAALSFYLSNFSHCDTICGSLGAASGPMAWMCMLTIIVLFGAELSSEIEHQTTRDYPKWQWQLRRAAMRKFPFPS
jgi:hypothetical protein